MRIIDHKKHTCKFECIHGTESTFGSTALLSFSAVSVSLSQTHEPLSIICNCAPHSRTFQERKLAACGTTATQPIEDVLKVHDPLVSEENARQSHQKKPALFGLLLLLL